MMRMLMPCTLRAWPLLTACVAMLMLASSAAHAHLMVAQKGTLNLSGTGGFLLLSVPVSGLRDVDDDADGLLSAAELQHHSASIIAQLKAGVQLLDGDGPRPLEGLMLHLSSRDGHEGQPGDQVIAMGRFALADAAGKTLALRFALWGTTAAERSLTVTITKDLKAAQLLLLTPQHPQARLYPSTQTMVLAFIRIGMGHVLSGLDHLLFLLVVVAAGLRWRKLVTVLTVFTLGHAISLTVIVIGGVTAPSRVVEPAIAATITALALYDLWADKLGTSASAWRLGPAPSVRSFAPFLGLVLCCSLIHGLGLGNALAVLGLDAAHQGATLFGFNLGIELGQLCIATVATVMLLALQTVLSAPQVQLLHIVMRLTAVIIGLAWIVQRVLFA